MHASLIAPRFPAGRKKKAADEFKTHGRCKPFFPFVPRNVQFCNYRGCASRATASLLRLSRVRFFSSPSWDTRSKRFQPCIHSMPLSLCYFLCTVANDKTHRSESFITRESTSKAEFKRNGSRTRDLRFKSSLTRHRQGFEGHFYERKLSRNMQKRPSQLMYFSDFSGLNLESSVSRLLLPWRQSRAAAVGNGFLAVSFKKMTRHECFERCIILDAS